MISCGKEVETFEPTTTLKTLLKNGKLNKAYYELRTKHLFLESRLDTVESFKTFVKETKIEELVSLTECEQPIVRCFAFKALAEKDYRNIREILLHHESDVEIIQVHDRCIQWNIPVREYMLRQLEPFAKVKYRFRRKEYEEVQKEFSKN